MRLISATIAASILALAGCSSFSATVVKANDDAGISTGGKPTNGGTTSSSDTSTAGNSLGGSSEQSNSTAAGTSSTSGGVPSVGGTSSIGGATSTGDTMAVAGATSGGGSTAGATAASTGGTGAPAGASSVGGTTSTSGGSSQGGTAATGTSAHTGGASACTKDADCTNPDPDNCSYTCVNPGATGTCKPAALKGPTQCATEACDDKPISGFWDANGKPHIAFAWTETDGTASIRMQQLKLDGTLDGAAVPYKLPADLLEPRLLSAEAQGSKVAFLWGGQQDVVNGADLDTLQFVVTDALGTSAAPVCLDTASGGLHLMAMSVTVTPAGAWLALRADGYPVYSWGGASGSSITALSDLVNSPYDHEFASGVQGNTLMLTGANCASVSLCKQSFVVQRYNAANLSAIGDPITLSPNIQSSTPAMGSIGGQIALLWTETQSPGELFRTLIKEDGTFALPVGTTQSAIQPKAVVQSVNGGAFLIGTIAVGIPTTYQVVGQRLAANLGLVGSPLPLADSEDSDATNFETHISSDGNQVLVTYNQIGAKYRLLSTNSCN
jgi:hypothetical protein